MSDEAFRRISSSIYSFILKFSDYAGLRCYRHGGIPHPENKFVCCPQACGRYCGAPDCHEGPGGAEQCCRNRITQSCNTPGNAAPCLGRNVQKIILSVQLQ